MQTQDSGRNLGTCIGTHSTVRAHVTYSQRSDGRLDSHLHLTLHAPSFCQPNGPIVGAEPLSLILEQAWVHLFDHLTVLRSYGLVWEGLTWWTGGSDSLARQRSTIYHQRLSPRGTLSQLVGGR